MNKLRYRVPLILIGAVLIVGAFAALHGELAETKPTFRGNLTGLLPAKQDLPKWEVSQRPLAESPEQQKGVSELLNFSDAAYVEYESPGMRVSIYLAYWAPGRMPHRLVAGHTPDVCWVGGGWIPRETDRVESTASSGSWTLEHRIFEMKGQREHVVFCHLVDGVPTTYGTGREPPWYAMFADMFRSGLRQRGEQFFIRISSDRPWGEFKDAAPVRLFLERVARVVRVNSSVQSG